jgi:hypothetical protein
MSSTDAARDGALSERNTPLVPLDNVVMYFGMAVTTQKDGASSAAAF